MSRIKDLQREIEHQEHELDDLAGELGKLKKELKERHIISDWELFSSGPGCGMKGSHAVNVQKLEERQWLLLQHLRLMYVPPPWKATGSLEPIPEQEDAGNEAFDKMAEDWFERREAEDVTD